MHADIVFPNRNEKEFLEIAEKLGYGRIVFAYENADKIPTQMPKSKIRILTGIATNEKGIQKAKNKAGFVLVKSIGNDRWAFEKSEADIIFGLEEAQKKDFMHHRASGLNQVLCKIAQQKGKMIALPFSTLLKAKGMLRAQLMGKMMQNIRFCRKYKVNTILASFAQSPYQMRAVKDLMALGMVLGMHPKEADDAMSWIK